MNGEQFIKQHRSELIQRKLERCKPPGLQSFSFIDDVLGMATIGAYYYYKTAQINREYLQALDKYQTCLKENSRILECDEA